MIRSSCVNCGASLWRGIERDIGQVLADVAPLTVAEEVELVVRSLLEDGQRRRRLTYDVLTLHGRDAPVLECRRAWKPDRPRGYVIITHRCGQPPAARVPLFFPEEENGDPPFDRAFFPRAREPLFSPGTETEPFFPPYADLFSPGTESELPDALARLAPIPKGTCALCGLRVERKGSRLCNRCGPFAHGRIYADGQPVVGWCEVSAHRRRTALRNADGLWDCGRHQPATLPAGSTPRAEVKG